jgi:hypothetical protein
MKRWLIEEYAKCFKEDAESHRNRIKNGNEDIKEFLENLILLDEKIATIFQRILDEGIEKEGKA